jgi:transcriptional regulator with XRE-family HTH domain
MTIGVAGSAIVSIEAFFVFPIVGGQGCRGGLVLHEGKRMSPERAPAVTTSPLLDFVKEMSGRRIEQARRRNGLTQSQFAREVGISMRWLREIEAGNPSSRLDDHVVCAQYLRLSTGHIFLPLLFSSQDMEFPRELSYGDFSELERECIDLIAERNIKRIQTKLTPRWWSKRPDKA